MKNLKAKIPIVFIPGTDDWSFGISAFVYEPFIMMLESMVMEMSLRIMFFF
ncbi:hypothetical protein V7166_13060 [Bacillus thuringiensis]